jgi:hypothetical protein
VKAIHHVACGYCTQHISGLHHQGWHTLSGVQAFAIGCALDQCEAFSHPLQPADKLQTGTQVAERRHLDSCVCTWPELALLSCVVVAGYTEGLCMSGNAGATMLDHLVAKAVAVNVNTSFV